MKRTLALALAAGLFPSGAHAYDAGTTHAGLTERAALVSSLGRRFAELFGLPSGIYETLRFEAKDARTTDLRARLARLDPGQGYAPDGGRLPALGWIVAGSVVEEVPPERERNHFFDAASVSARGLHQGGAGASLSFGTGSVEGGVESLRDLFTGHGGGGKGQASTDWLASPDNDLSLLRFLDARERAVSAATAAERESALAEALLIAGALLHVVEDAGEPAHVHNDFRTDLYRRGAPFERYVAARFGRLAVPGPSAGAESVLHLADLIHTPSGTGLADRTAQRFFSLGLLAGDEDVTRPEHMPQLVPGRARRGYLVDADKHHLARYERVGTTASDAAAPNAIIQWDLDGRCFEDEARILLPETARAALSAIEHLFRDPLATDGSVVKNGPLALGKGRLSVLAEQGDGSRKTIASTEVSSVAAAATLVDLPEAARSAARWAVVFRGVDGAGEPIVVSIEHAGEAE